MFHMTLKARKNKLIIVFIMNTQTKQQYNS